MRIKAYFILIIIGLSISIFGCRLYSPCGIFDRVYKLNVRDVPKTNNGNYYLCILEEEPLIFSVDSSLRNSFPKHLINKRMDYVLIKLKVKPVDMFFTVYSREEALNMWSALYCSNLQEGNKYEDPVKAFFLEFNTLYYITCNATDIKKFKKFYNEKSLFITDRIFPEEETKYYYCLNVYSAKKVDFNKLYSFDNVLKDYMEIKTQIEQ